MTSNLCTDIGYQSVNKFGEQLCGDHVDMVEQEDSEILVLADGLGSGVKASILSTLTAKIISTMIAAGMKLEDCVETIAQTLPVCQVRGIAYSTFTIIRITQSREAEIIQYDNPHVFLLRDGKNTPMDETSLKIGDKIIYKSRLALCEGDTFVAISDGAVHAGIGMSLNYGWQRENIIEFMEMMYDQTFTAKTLATMLLDQCCHLYGEKPGDDTTVCVVRVRPRTSVNLMIGPPANPDDVNKMMSLFFSKSGKHIVCGGTTSKLAGEYLGKPVVPDLTYIDPEIPPVAKIAGVELVTEGVITISRVLTYAKSYLDDNSCYKQWSYKKDGASLIARMLFEDATDINFYVGKAVNPAHQNPSLPIGFNIKMQLVQELSEALSKMGKNIKVSEF